MSDTRWQSPDWIKWTKTDAYKLLSQYTQGKTKGQRNRLLSIFGNAFIGWEFDGSLDSLEQIGRGNAQYYHIGAGYRKMALEALGIMVNEHIPYLSILRRTVGNKQWLNGLSDEQWQIIRDEVLPHVLCECRHRGAIE